MGGPGLLGGANGDPMGTLWKVNGNPVGTQWEVNGNPMGTLWEPIGNYDGGQDALLPQGVTGGGSQNGGGGGTKLRGGEMWGPRMGNLSWEMNGNPVGTQWKVNGDPMDCPPPQLLTSPL